MLVAEDRDAAAAGFEHLHDLPEELVTWIQRLASLVLRVFAVLADDDDAIDRELGAAQCEGLRNGRENRHAVPLGRRTRQITLRKLIDIERDKVDVRPAPAALPRVAEE